MSPSCPVQINSLSTRMSDKTATQTKRMLCCKCLKFSKNVHSLAAIKYVLQVCVPHFYLRVSLWPHALRSHRMLQKMKFGWERRQPGYIGREQKKISSHSTNLFKYIQYKSIHIHYSAADITKSNVTKNPVGKVRERRNKLVHSNRNSIAFGCWREGNGLLLYRLLWSKPLHRLRTVAGLTALT